MRLLGRIAGLGAVTMLACGKGPSGDTGGAQVVVTTTSTAGDSALIGAAGGALLSSEGVGVRIPAGALAGDTQIQIHRSQVVPPASLNPVFQAYDFLPADQTFSGHVTLELPLPAGTSVAVIYLLLADGSGWEMVGGASWGGSIKADVTRFGTAFAAATK